MWMKTVSSVVAPEVLDLPIGTVGMHGSKDVDSSAGVTWSSRRDGRVEVSGGVWLARKTLGRAMRWTLSVGGRELARGDLTSSDPYTSDNPFPLVDGTADPESLRFRVSRGAVVALELVKTSPAAEFCGVRLTIRHSSD
jgi:hypothetical protein